MRVQEEGREYEGTAAEIVEQLRQANAPDRIPDAESYVEFMSANYTRTTGLPCVISGDSLEERSMAMLTRLIQVGALLLLDDSSDSG